MIVSMHGAPKKDEDSSTINIINRTLILQGYFGAFSLFEIASLSWDQVSFVAKVAIPAIQKHGRW